MANIDVSEVLNDSDFTSAVKLIRRIRSVNQYGENVLTEQVPEAVKMVIQPGKDSQLLRMDDSVRLREVINIWFNGLINIEAVNGYSDVIVWGGNRYQATDQKDFTNYGIGYTAAVCVLEKVSV